VPHGPEEIPLAAVKEDQSPLDGPLGWADVYEAKAAEFVKLPPKGPLGCADVYEENAAELVGKPLGVENPLRVEKPLNCACAPEVRAAATAATYW